MIEEDDDPEEFENEIIADYYEDDEDEIRPRGICSYCGEFYIDCICGND